MAKILKGFVLALLMLVLTTSPVLAVANPTSIGIGDVYVFEDVLEDGDVVVYVRYDASYAVEPDEDADDTFIVAIYDTNGTTLLFTRALNYYQHNIISIYLDAATNTLVSGSAYYVRVMGSPALFEIEENVNMDTRVLVVGDYRGLVDLGGVMIAQAEILEADWGTTLLTSNDKLNSTGSYYFLKAIPGLSSMVPTIFEVSSQIFTFANTNTNTTGLNRTKAKMPVSLNSATNGLNTIFGITNPIFGQFGWLFIMGLMVGAVVYATTRRPDVAILGGVISTLAVEAWMGAADGNMLTFLMAVGTIIIVIAAVEFFLPRYG